MLGKTLEVEMEALGMAGFCMPRDFWSAFPGGMPYVWFDPTFGEPVGVPATV